MPDAFKRLKPQHLVVTAALLFGGIGAGYGVYASVDGPGQPVVPAPPALPTLIEQQAPISLAVIPVRTGDLSKVMSIRGRVVFPNRDTLTFRIEGRVGEVLVDEGQPVWEGQPLVRVDTETVARLERSVVLARVGLRDAERALTEINSPPTALEMAEAEATLANARVGHKMALDTLARLLEPTARDIAQIDGEVANSRIALSDAREALARLLEPGQEEVAQAEAAVISAKISVKEARLALGRKKSGLSEAQFSEAQSLVDVATTTLSNGPPGLRSHEEGLR